MNLETINEQLASSVETAAYSTDVAPEVRAQLATNSLLSTIADIFKKGGISILPFKDQIKAAVLNLYDTHIAPIDILPTKLASLEVLADAAARVMLTNVLDSLFAALETPTT